MSEKLGIDLRMQALRMFLDSKRRCLPKTEMELGEWLLEFADHSLRLAESWQKAFEEHMGICNRPIIIQKDDTTYRAGLEAAAPGREKVISLLRAIENRLINMTPADMSCADADRRDGALFIISSALKAGSLISEEEKRS